MSEIEEVKPASNTRLVGVSIFLSSLAIAMIIGGVGIGYYELNKAGSVIDNSVTSMQRDAEQNKSDIVNLQKALQDMHGLAEKSVGLSEKQGQMIADWETAQQGNFEKWYVAEADYLVRLANDHIAYTKNTAMALTLLQRADQVLSKLNSANVMPIRQAIAANIASLQSTPSVDVTQLYLTLTALNAEIAKLPLPAGPIQAAENKVAPVQDNQESSWWRKGLTKTWDTLKSSVIVRYNGSEALPLVLPKEREYLYDNLHNQMQNAIWALLHSNWTIYQASLNQSTEWVKHYFVLNAPETQTMLARLQELANLNIQPPKADLAPTMQLLNDYLGQSAQRVVTKGA